MTGTVSARPLRKLAVLACMDARLDPYRLLGLERGDAHVIRNAGGIATDDAIRSLTISQRLLGTEEVVVIHHTDCGMLTFKDEDLRASLATETGATPPWSTDYPSTLDDGVRQTIDRLRESPFLASRDRIRGYVYEVETGRLREVEY
jgi:carbonic anhydrase